MKLNLDKKWFEKKAKEEENFEIAAGELAFNVCKKDTSVSGEPSANLVNEDNEEIRFAFGTLVKFRRLEMGLTLEQLAEKARIDTLEIKRIEHNYKSIPKPRTITQLADTLKISERILLKLSGLTTSNDSDLEQNVVRFAARLENLEQLSENERMLLDEFVEHLNSKEK